MQLIVPVLNNTYMFFTEFSHRDRETPSIRKRLYTPEEFDAKHNPNDPKILGCTTVPFSSLKIYGSSNIELQHSKNERIVMDLSDTAYEHVFNAKPTAGEGVWIEENRKAHGKSKAVMELAQEFGIPAATVVEERRILLALAYVTKNAKNIDEILEILNKSKNFPGYERLPTIFHQPRNSRVTTEQHIAAYFGFLRKRGGVQLILSNSPKVDLKEMFDSNQQIVDDRSAVCTLDSLSNDMISAIIPLGAYEQEKFQKFG